MDNVKELPDAEFDIVRVVWAMELPVTTAVIREQLEKEKEWKIQIIVSLTVFYIYLRVYETFIRP